ncbi:MAG: oligosaccharide flippase family protein [Candidatus Binatus sp.]|uniref:lipopolysaccharide biosynthesis protein n=1 Tax=Candidatus Binatus sp. TaxID=2811406 RepID=UPI00271BA0A8|nr:oligosaccharide flippase family protein [Candidatus Binatus sp.]MDO8432777.1 oligosaccharide flippase family protein [Candidatus Binatus sp.]
MSELSERLPPVQVEDIEPAGRPARAQIGSSTLALGAIVSLGGRLAGRAFRMSVEIALARLLGPAGYGLYAVGFTLFVITAVISPLGLDQGVIYFGARYLHDDAGRFKGVLFRSVGYTVLAGSILAIGCFLLAPWLANDIFRKPALTFVFRGFALAILMAAALKTMGAATRISHNMRRSVLAEELVPPVSTLLLILVFFHLGWGVHGAVLAVSISFTLAACVAAYCLCELFPVLLSPAVKAVGDSGGLIRFSLATGALVGLTNIYYGLDRFLVAYFWAARDVGIYQAAAQTSNQFVTIVGAFSMALTPMIADLYHHGEIERLNELFKVSTKWALYLSLPLFAVIWVAPGDFMAALYGEHYRSGGLILAVLAVGQLINVATGAVFFLAVMTGQQKRLIQASAVAVAVTVGLDFLLIPRIGPVGAALGTTLVGGGMWIFMLLQLRSVLGLWPFDRRYLKGLTIAAMCVAFLVALHSSLGASPQVTIIVMGVCSVAIFAVALPALGLDLEDSELLALIRSRLFNVVK